MDLTRRQLLRGSLLVASGALVPGALAACASPPPQPPAQPTAEPAVDPIDAYITAEMAKRRIPGLALAVVQHGKTIKSRGSGVANLELDVPVRPDTVVELASVTKQFTATAIDVGYFLLGLVIEHASGQPYQDFLAARFFQPLGMTATSIPDKWTIVKNRADGYTIRNGEIVHIRRTGQIELPSHFGVHSTVEDLATWDTALAAGTVVKPASLAQMWTPATLKNGWTRPYGFGWEVKQQRGHRLITHAGITGTEYSRFPDDGLTVIVLTNLGRRLDTSGVDPYGLPLGVAGLLVPGLTTR